MPRRSSTSGSRLPYLTPQALEEEAALLLAEYGNKYGQVTTPPVPIDEIVENYLELILKFIDMKSEFGVDDVHGALWVNKKEVGIEQRLEPAENPSMLGRYRFTLAHETGHWRLHRHLFQRKANQLHLLPEGTDRPEYICRSSDREPIEIQADGFAACILMPREMIKRVWHEWRGNPDPIYLEDLQTRRKAILTEELMRRRSLTYGQDFEAKTLFENAIRPLAEKFQVSAEAMRIRLETLNLLQKKREPLLFD